LEICPYCGTRSPVADAAASPGSPADAANPPRCQACGGVLDDLSMTATQIAMGPWFFRMPGKPFGPGCDITILRKLLAAGRVKPDSPIRGPGSNQLWKKVKSIAGVAHLAGACHSCGEKVKPDSKFCPECGTKFTAPAERNQWGLPTAPVADVIAEARKADAALCCVCGHGKTTADECPECETIFSPPDEVTRITVGGWFVHGKQHAYKPGMSYEQIKKEVDAGNVTARTIVRGPTTEQFWKLAKNTPGVAHLLGACQACAAKVDAGAGACHVCGASFGVPLDADWVGLRYPTAEAAAAAQRQLDAELAKIAATMPAAPAPVRKPRVKRERPVAEASDVDATETVEEYVEAEQEYEENSGMPPGYEDDEHHDQGGFDITTESNDEQDIGFAAAHHEEEHHDEHHAEPALIGAGAAAGTAFDLGVAPISAGDTGKERRITTQYKQSQKTLITWLVVTPIIVIGAFLAINAIPSKDGTKDVAKDGQQQKDGGDHKAEASPQLVKLKKDTEARFAQFKNVERKGKAAAPMTEAEATLAKANQLMTNEQFLEADAEFRKVEAPLLKVEQMQQQRAQATEMRGRAQAAQNEAKALVAAQHAKEQWEEAEKSFAQGATLLNEENYDQAIVVWNNATEQYSKAARLVQVMLTAADVRAKIEAEATKTFTRDELEREDVAAWKAFKAKIKAGDDNAAEKKYEEAMQFFDQARQMVDSVNDGMKRQVGRNYWAYQTGRLTARILTPKVAGYHPDEEMLAQLKQAYVNLEINRDFFNRIPLSKNCSYKELADILVIECAKEIETTFEGPVGEAIKNSFGLGMQLYIVEKQLRADVGKMTTRTREEIDLYVKKVIPDAAKAAGYGPQFLADVKEFEETLATETNIPTKSREKWAAIIEKLENFETAMKIVGARK